MWELIRMLRDIVPMVKGMRVELKEIHEELTAIRIALKATQNHYAITVGTEVYPVVLDEKCSETTWSIGWNPERGDTPTNEC